MTLFSVGLPQFPGWLPSWQLFVATLAVGNAIQNFTTLKMTRRLYGAEKTVITPLHARTSAIWTLTSAMVRLYCAYNISNKVVYDMTIWTYLFAICHFGSEFLIFGTAIFNVPLVIPAIVSTTSLTWMLKEYNFYVKE